MRGVLVRELYSAARSASGQINENKFSIVRSIQVLSQWIIAKNISRQMVTVYCYPQCFDKSRRFTFKNLLTWKFCRKSLNDWSLLKLINFV